METGTVRRARLRPYIHQEEAESQIRNLEAVAEIVTADLPDVNLSPDRMTT